MAYIDEIKDRNTGTQLKDILNSFNNYFCSYAGSVEETRKQVPMYIRKEGLYITYVDYEHKVHTEYYLSNEVDNINWINNNNWAEGNNNLVGDISISSTGYWIINGQVTDILAKGEKGTTPILRSNSSKLQVSYDEGNKWEDITDKFISYPDDEDITVVEDTSQTQLLKFKDRTHNPNLASGKGYKILRRHWKEVNGVRKNILTQDMINDANTIYEIRYDFDLNGAEIQIKEGCVLNFVGGSLSNGTIIGNNSVVNSEPIVIFRNTIIKGNWLTLNIYQSWFDFDLSIDADNRRNFKNLIQLTNANITNNIYFCNGIYYTKAYDVEDISEEALLLLNSNTNLYLTGCTIKTIPFKWTHKNIILIQNTNNVNIYGGILIGDADTHDYDTTVSISHEFSHGIKIKTNSNNITIANTRLEKFTGDGIDLIESGENAIDNIQIINVVCDSNNRQGISIESGKNIFIKNSKFINTSSIHEIEPGAGLDIEPWTKNVYIENIQIENCSFERNKGGVIIQPNYLEDNPSLYENNIHIKNCVIDKSVALFACNAIVFENIANNINYFKITNAANIKIKDANILTLESYNGVLGLTLQNVNVSTRVLIDNSDKNDDVNIFNCEINELTFNAIKNFCTKNSTIKKLSQFLKALNYTAENSKVSISFVDTNCNFKDNYIQLENTNAIQISGELHSNIIVYNGGGSCNFGSSIIVDNTLINNSSNESPIILKQTDGEFEIIDNKLYGFKYLFKFDILPKKAKLFSNIPIRLYKGFIPTGLIEYYEGCLDNQDDIIKTYTNNAWRNFMLIGSSVERPIDNFKGQYFFDSGLNVPIFWDGQKWINSNGNGAYLNKGTTSQRPTLTSTDDGFEYYDNVLKKKILWNGIAWVNMDGTAL